MKFSLLRTPLVAACAIIGLIASAQDEKMIRSLYDEALQRGESYQMLEYLSKKVGPRLSGSPGAAAAVEYTRQVMKAYGFDTVWLQPVMVPHWVRGARETGRVAQSRFGSFEMNVCALGGAVGTGAGGVMANVVEVKSFDELKKLGTKNVAGKIVFFNRPLDASRINTFEAYGGAVDQRAGGASEAAKLGAVAVLVRSMGQPHEEYPHTGSLRYTPNVAQIPAVAISTKHADELSRILRDDPTLTFYLEIHCQTLPDELSYNVIGELTGSEKPQQIIVVSGHLDSWDLGEGAHDDGAGCVQAIEVLRLYKALNYKPKHTIRAVMFMNEENGLRGGIMYAKVAAEKKEKHVAAIESDRGGFTPRGFTVQATDAVKAAVQRWQPLLSPYDLWDFSKPGGGADIGPLAPQGVPLFGFLPDSQRYFDVHHTREDVFENVNRRELELGAAAMAAFTYLIDTHGLPE